MPLLSPRSLAATFTPSPRASLAFDLGGDEVIRTSADNDPYPSHAYGNFDPAASDVVRDGDSGVMWGRVSGAPNQFRVVTRASQARSRAHLQRPSTREPLRQLEEQFATLPVLRDAVTAEYAGTPNASVTPSTRPAASPRGRHAVSHFVHPSSISSVAAVPASHGSSFGRSVVSRHCGSFVLAQAGEAQAEIGALRLELDLLRRAAASRDAGTASATITAFAFSEENFQTLCMENGRLRELLEASVKRYDEATLARTHHEQQSNTDKTAAAKAQAELISLRASHASLEQAAANFEFARADLERRAAYAEEVRLAARTERDRLHTELEEVEREHAHCAAFKSHVEEEREEWRRAAEQARESLARSAAERDTLSTTCAQLEAHRLAHLADAERTHAETRRARDAHADAMERAAKLAEELATERSRSRVAEDALERALKDLSQTESARTRLLDELERAQRGASESALSVAALAQHRSDAEAALEKLRRQLEARMRELSEAQDQLAAGATRDAAYARLKEENATLRRQVETTAAQHRDSTDALASAEEQARRLKADLASTRRSHSSVQAALGRLESKLLPPDLSGMDPSSLDPIQLLHRIRELEVAVKEHLASAETARRIHDQCRGHISRAEREADREANLRRIQLKSAKEVRRRLEGQVSASEVRLAAALKTMAQLGAQGAKAAERFAATMPPPIDKTTKESDDEEEEPEEEEEPSEDDDDADEEAEGDE